MAIGRYSRVFTPKMIPYFYQVDKFPRIDPALLLPPVFINGVIQAPLGVYESSLERRARLFANVRHAKQIRKYTGEPYVTHPFRVAQIVQLADSYSPTMVCGAWLHDTVEDTGVTCPELAAIFDPEVASMVARLSKNGRAWTGNRQTRHEAYVIWLAGALHDTKTVKIADILDNSATIVDRDPEFAKVYLKEKRQELNVCKAGDLNLWTHADKMLKSFGY
jgi:(p)ppGpp synthase/HD superfamily hydrolase